MDIDELITPAAVVARLRVANKKQLLQEISRRAAALVELHERQIFDSLLERERLGSTGVGNGIAIPHAKLPGLTHLQGLFVRLVRIAVTNLAGVPASVVGGFGLGFFGYVVGGTNERRL